MTVNFTIQIPKSPELNEAIEKKTAKLKSLLHAFEPGLVRLHGRILRHSEREGVVCKLDLWLPTGQMAAEGTGETAQLALRLASDELMSQVKKHKQKLRDVHARRRVAPPPVAVAPGDSKEARAAASNDLSRYFGAHYSDLLAFVERQIQVRERLGDLKPDQMDAREVLDEVVVSALDQPPERGQIQRGRWLLVLAADAMRRLQRQNGNGRGGMAVVSLDKDLNPEEMNRDGLELEGFTPDQETDLRFSDVTPALGTGTPEDVAYTEEILDQLEASLRKLPEQERTDLVLFLMEGFLPEELAALTQRPVERVRESLRDAQEHLRRQPSLPAILQRRLQVASGA